MTPSYNWAGGAPLPLSDSKDITLSITVANIVTVIREEVEGVCYQGQSPAEALEVIARLVEGYDYSNEPRRCPVCEEPCHLCGEGKCEVANAE